MSPPISLSACPPEIRANPLPGDRCTAPDAPVHPRESYFRRVSGVLELPAFSVRSGRVSDLDFRYRGGIYGIFRPHSFAHVGLGIDSDFASELTLLARGGGRIPFHALNMYGVNLTALAGLRQVFDQVHAIGGVDQPVSGSLFTFGAEVAPYFQMWHEFSLLPYFRFLASPPSEVEVAAGGRGTLPWSWEMQFGLGLSFDFLPDSN
jgi:hypothetical protein